MATKPTSANFTWATDTNFSAGPASGQPTKVNPAGWPSAAQGFVPGSGVVAEFMNRVLNVLGQWSGWLDAGSSAGAADAHIVETDSNGDTAVHKLGFTGALGGLLYRTAANTSNHDGSTPIAYPTGVDRVRITGEVTGDTEVTLPDTGDYGQRRIGITRALATIASNGNSLIVRDGLSNEIGRLDAETNGTLVVESDGAAWRAVTFAGAWTNVVF